MSHSWYVCNVEARTCFDLGSSIMTDEFEDICRMICFDGISLEDVITYDVERLMFYDDAKIAQLYYYIRSIPPDQFAWTGHEDDLCEGVFNYLEVKKPIYQVGSIYTNHDKHTFGKCFEDK